MRRPSHTGWRHLVITLAVVALPVAAPAQPSSSGPADAELRRQVTQRFAVVPLAEGVALSGATQDRRFEIDDGVVMASGVPLSGDELRRRLGADAALVLRLSYLDNATLKRVFAPPATSAAQIAPARPSAPSGPVSPSAVPAAAAPPSAARSLPGDAERVRRRTGARLAFAKSIVVAADEDVSDSVFAVGGSVRVDGRVQDDIVVVGGDLDLGPTAEVRGDITVVGGELTMAPGAVHTGRVNRGASGGFGRWNWPAVGWSRFDLGPSARWLSLAGTLVRVTLLGLAIAFLTLVARGRVARIGAVVTATPLKAALVGLATQVLFVPALIVVAVVMAVTIVGLPFVAVVIPLAVVTMCGAMLLGFAGLAGALGRTIGRRAGWITDAAVAAALLGVAVVVLPTVLSRLVGVAPEFLRAAALALLAVGTAIEYVAWTIGLGAAVMTGLGKWAVVPPPLPPPAPPEVFAASSVL